MILLYLPFLPLFFILPLLNSTPLFPFPPHRILPLCPALLNNSPLHPFLRLKPPFGTGGDPKNTHLTFPLHLNISISYYGCFVLPLLLLCRFPLPLGNGYFPISLLTKLPLSQSCMTDSSLFPSIFSPNFVINIKLSTPKTHARLVSLNSLPPHPLLGKNVALPPPRSQNIQGLYALHQVTFVLPPPNLILLSGPLVPFGPIFPPPFSPHWTSLLHQYAHASPSFPPCSAPSTQDFFHATITSPDSAPGADGLPYAAWRVCPTTSSICLNQHFQDIIFRKVRPPQQSLVFIPKADQGEYADNYRPLGLPNTCDRIIDRAAYSLFCQTLMNSLHPAQALLNLFREPQYNYLEVQDFLNCSHEERAVLLSDLAKAFERVNPHWIIHVLMCRGVSYWVLNYCRHILFGRRVLHKIHSTFRPPLAIHNGVDMGRAFSVLLFCIAMDPWYYHVHQIPRVLINRGYMDDNATGGSGLEWLFTAQTLFQKFSEAGFVVLSHHCYTVERIPEPSYQTPSFLTCEPVTKGFPSLRAAFPHLPQPSYLRICSGSRCIILHSSLLSFYPYITCREYPHILPFLHTAPCKCKCKTFLLPNFSLSSSHLSLLDSTPWGCKILPSSATMLGLFLHSPQSQPTPSYDEQMSLLPLSPPFARSTIEASQLRKPIATMQKRTRACSALGLSFRDRTIFLSFYVLSLPVYHHSTLLPSSPFYRTYFTLIRRLLAPRHWIQASQLPGIVTYLRLGILHCPHIHLTCSLSGYCLRCYGEPIALWLCYVTPTLPPMPAQLREGLHTVRRLLLSANPYNPEPFIYPLQRHLHNDHSPYKLSRLILSHVKVHLRQQLFYNARTFLRERLSQVDWAFSSSSFTLEALHETPIKAIPSFSRLAILRWTIDSEPDVHFRLRPHFTRSSPCRCGCGKFSSLFPFGFQSGSVHHSHFSFPLTWTLLACPSLLSSFPRFFREQHPPLPPFTSPPTWYTRTGLETASLDTLSPSLARWLSHPCILCGRGWSNKGGQTHRMRWDDKGQTMAAGYTSLDY